jgi:hypothetical protein
MLKKGAAGWEGPAAEKSFSKVIVVVIVELGVVMMMMMMMMSIRPFGPVGCGRLHRAGETLTTLIVVVAVVVVVVQVLSNGNGVATVGSDNRLNFF